MKNHRKTSLIHQIKEPLQQNNGYFIEHKVNQTRGRESSQQHRHQPAVSALATALDRFFEQVIESHTQKANNKNTQTTSQNNTQEQLFLLRWRIQNAIGSAGCGVLMESMPHLSELMMMKDDDRSTPVTIVGSIRGLGRVGRIPTGASATASTSGTNHSNRFHILLCKLIGAIAHEANPVALFIDDLQWADDVTLDVVRMVMVRLFLTTDSLCFHTS